MGEREGQMGGQMEGIWGTQINKFLYCYKYRLHTEGEVAQ